MTAQKTWRALELIEWTAGYFERAGIPSPRLDAELLLAHALNQNRMWLYLNYEHVVSGQPLSAYRELVRRRHAREPVAYLTGRREFMSLSFEVNSGTLIPRPETETLVELALKRLRSEERACLKVAENGADESVKLADIGCGSGAIGVALAHALQEDGAAVVATDISEAALETARRNAESAGVGGSMEFRLGDGLSVFHAEERFDAVVSNPPYVRTADLERLPPESRLYEPRAALDGGADGFAALRPLISGVGAVLKPGGFAAFEVGEGQAEQARALFEASPLFESAKTALDMSGVERVVYGIRASAA